ncbi:aspartic acid-rich protein, partial [Natronobacterium gregoryi SP2]
MTDAPHSTSRRTLLATTGSLTALGVAGCLGDDGDGDDHGDEHDDDDDHDDDHDHDDDPDHGDVYDEIGIEEFEVLDRDHEEDILVYVHGDHWHDDPLEVPHDDNLSLGAYVEDEEGDEVELGDELELTGEVVEGANE